MQQYRIKVTLEDVYCRDTESVHSADKLAVAGAVTVDGTAHGIVMPTMSIDDYQRKRFPDDLAVVFEGGSDTGEVRLYLQAWDLDENDGWLENREEIDQAALAIAVGVAALNPVAGAVVVAVWDVVTSVVDRFVAWDRDDELLRTTQVVQSPAIPLETQYQTVEVPFVKKEDPDYSGYDYVLTFSVESTWQASFGDAPAQPLTYEPYPGAPLEAWLGDWVGTDLEVSVGRSSGDDDQRLGGAALDVTVTRKVGGEATPTTTRGLVPEQASGASAGSRLREALSPGRRAGRALGQEADLGAPTGLEALGGGGGGGAAGPGGVHEGIGAATAGGALRNREDGTRVETPEVLDRERVGDVVRLPDDAGLELLRTTGAVPAVELLRYARPFAPLVNELTGGRDVVLHRRANL